LPRTAVLVRCPKCDAKVEIPAQQLDACVECPCGKFFTAPTRRGISRFAMAMIIVGVTALIGCGLFVRAAIRFKLRSQVEEARSNLRQIATAELAYFRGHRMFVAAGPTPTDAPGVRKRVFVPDDGFTALSWLPEGVVRYQYSVVLTGPSSALVVAHGDLNEDGKQSEYKLAIIGDGTIGPIEEKDPFE
jgi:hypothetical protein